MHNKNNNINPATVALEWAKQIITLSSAFIVLSSTFLGRIFREEIDYIYLLFGSWILLFVAIIFATWFISGLANILSLEGNKFGFGIKNITIAKISRYAFVIAILLFIGFSIINTHKIFTATRSRDSKEILSIEIPEKDKRTIYIKKNHKCLKVIIKCESNELKK